MNNQTPEASATIIYGLALNTPAHVVDRLADALACCRRRVGTRWRTYDERKQAVLTCVYLEGGHTYRSLGKGNGIPESTCQTMICKGVKVLARRALPLTEVVRLAVKAGWKYLIVNGVNIPTERVTAKWGKKHIWYSGQHKLRTQASTTLACDFFAVDCAVTLRRVYRTGAR